MAESVDASALEALVLRGTYGFEPRRSRPLRRELRELVDASYAVMNDMFLAEGVKPWRYGPGEATYFAGQFDRIMAKRGVKPELFIAPRVHALKARIATADDWATPAQAAA